MKKTKLTRSLLAACSIVALTAVMYGCVHSGGDGPALSKLDLTGYDTADGVDVEEKTYSTDGVPPALVSALTGYVGPTMVDTDKSIIVGDFTLTCVAGPCSITVSPDESHFTVVGTINVATTSATSGSPGPTDAEVRAEAMLIAAAIGPGSTRADATPGDDDETNNLPFTIDGGEITEEPATADDMDDDFGEPGTASWTSDDTGSEVRWTATYTDREDFDDDGEGVRDWVLTYSDIADPTDAAYSEHYPDTINQGDRDGVDSAADGVLTLSTAQTGNHDLFSITFGLTAAHQTIPITHDDPATTEPETESEYEGMFTGVPGTFTCTDTCEVASDDMGNLMTLTGTWTFAPDAEEEGADPHMAIGVVPDPDYMDFGIWVQRTTDDEQETTVAALAFAHGAEDRNYVTDPIVGTASYTGPSLGIYMTKQFDPVSGEAKPTGSGNYYATAELTAYFGGDDVAASKQDTITGTVKHFGADDENGDFMLFPGTENWVLNLMLAADGSDVGDAPDKNVTVADGSIEGVTMGMNGDIEGEAGTWNGQFHGADDTETDGNDLPVSVSGTYDGHFSNGHVLGAFGANMVEED